MDEKVMFAAGAAKVSRNFKIYTKLNTHSRKQTAKCSITISSSIRV